MPVRAGIPVRFAASKLVEGDQLVEQALNLEQNEKEMIEHIIVQMEEERGIDRSAAIADMRFSFIQKLCDQTVIKPGESKEHERSRKIDAVLTGRYTGTSNVCCNHGTCILADIWCDRRRTSKCDGDWN